MSQKNRTELRNKDFLVVRQTKNQNIVKVITPQTFQIGLDDSEFQNGLIVKGSAQLAGRLLDSSGASFLKGSDAVTVTEDASGGVTISATLGTGATLSGAEVDGIEAFTYDGSSTATIKVDLYDNAGIIKTSNGLALDISTTTDELSATPAADDLLFIYDADSPGARTTKKITVNNLMSAASSLSSLGNPLTLRDGLGNTSYNNSVGVTADLTLAANSGLNIVGGIGSGGGAYVDPNAATVTAALDAASDYVLIYDATANATRKIVPQKFANLASDYAISVGTGLTYAAGSAYDGSANTAISLDTSSLALLAGNNALSGNNTFSGKNTFGVSTTSGLTGSIQEVAAGVPYLIGGSNVSITTGSNGQISIAASMGAGGSLTAGTAISSFTYDGTGNATVSVNATSLATTTANRSNFVLAAEAGNLSNIMITSMGSIADSVDRTAIVNAGQGIDITFAGNSNPATFRAKVDGTTIVFNGSNQLSAILPSGGVAGGGNSDKAATYLVLSATGSLDNERVFTYGTGITGTDAGAGSTLTVGIDNSIVATLTGSQFSGNVGITGSLGVEAPALFNQGLTGSLTKLPDGTSYIREGLNIGIVSSSDGSITISSTNSGGTITGVTAGDGLSGGGSSGNVTVNVDLATDPGLKFTSNKLDVKVNPNDTIRKEAAGLTVNKVPNNLIQGAGINSFGFDGSSSGQVVSVDPAQVPFLSNDNVWSGDNVFSAGLTGSLQTLSDGTTKYLVGIGGISVATASSGQVIISGSAGQLYTAGVGLSLTGEQFSADNSIVATLTGSQFSGNVGITGSLGVESSAIFQLGLSGSLQMLPDGITPYIIGTGSVSVTTSSSGQLVISSSAVAGASGLSSIQQSGGSSFSNVDTLIFTGSTLTGGAGTVTVTPVIGAAEDSSYTDGLFTDFSYTTPIGTAVDRFNEVLKGLAPSAAPTLDDINCTDSGAVAKLSFGTAQSISGYTNAQPSTLTPSSGFSDVNINGSYTSTTSGNDVRVACFAGSTTIDGILNADVVADSPNFSADAFGNGDQGILKLFVNDNSTEVHSTDLSSFGSGTSVNGNGSGFVLSAVTDGSFSDGSPFTTFKHRTGTYTIATSDQRTGWNYARIVHTIGSTATTTNYVEWINDSNANALSADNSAMDTLSMSGAKKLSGVTYHTAGTAQYRVRALNAYRNVYSTSNITFNGTNCAVPSQAFPSIDYGSGENEAKILHLTGSASINADPLLNESFSVSSNVPSPLKSNLSSAGSQAISGILLYNLSDTSTTTSETFRGESYRRISGSYATQAAVIAGGAVWSSSTSLTTVDGLLFYDSKLKSPAEGGISGDFRNSSDGGSIANGPSSNVDYSSITSGIRTFYRYFKNTSGGSKTDFTLTLNGSGTIVSQITSLSTSNIHILAKLPETPSTFTTGWMDLAIAFATGQTADGSGCLNGSLDASLNATNNVTFGTQSVGANEYIVIKVEADASWTGNISQMSISWS